MTQAPMAEVQGKVAFITGAVSGVGLGIAKAFAMAGMKVVGTYRRDDHLREAKAWFDERPELAAHFVKMDVTDRAQIKAAADEAERVFGKVHVLVNNAGVNVFGPMDQASDQDWAWVMGVNFYGVLHGVMEFLPRIKRHGEGGHIVNVGSMGSFLPGPQAGLYTVSKYAVRGYTECLRDNLAPFNIGVSLMAPGLVKSNIHESVLHRPEGMQETAFPPNSAEIQQVGDIHALGMDPVEAGEKTLRGMRRNDLYILTHPEHREDLEEIFNEVLAALPDEPADPKRLEVEEARRRAKRTAQTKVIGVSDILIES